MIRLQKVIEFATEKHSKQVRKESGVPYIFHPIAVANRLQKLGIVDEILLASAILHDVVEDCGVTLTELFVELKEIGYNNREANEIIGLVAELTREETSDITKEKYLQSFFKSSIEALIIKVLDRIENVEDFTAYNRNYAPKYFRKGKAIFEAFADRMDEFVTRFSQVTYDDIEYWIDDLKERLYIK